MLLYEGGDLKLIKFGHCLFPSLWRDSVRAPHGHGLISFRYHTTGDASELDRRDILRRGVKLGGAGRLNLYNTFDLHSCILHISSGRVSVRNIILYKRSSGT